MRSGSATLLRRFVRQKSGIVPTLHGNSSTGRWFRAAAIAGNTQSTQGVWARMSDEVVKAWRMLDEDLHREEAESPFQLDKAEAPSLRMSAGQLSIAFPIRKGIPPAVVKNEIHKQMIGLSNATGGLYTENRIVDQGSEEFMSTLMPAGLKVTMCTPFSHNRQPCVQFMKHGALSDDELAVFSAVLRSANLVTADKVAAVAAQARQSDAQSVQDFGLRSDLSIEEEWEQLQQAGIRSLMSAFRHFMNDDDQGVMRAPGELRERVDRDGQVYLPLATQPHRTHPSQRGQADAAVKEKFEYGSRDADQAAQKLQSLGAMVYPPGKEGTFDWGILAGYADQKQQIEDTMLLALQHPQIYEAIAKSTRRQYSDNKPRAVLFEGPPGTGKTTSARVIASQASVALVYVPLEAVASKWYGESERLLADVFKAAEMLPGCIIFLDEVDSLATTRSSEMHEATRRLLGVLLRHLDGFETNKRSVVIAATNRKEDLDPALLSRFNTSVQFGLPDEACRAQILQQYAKHLKEEELAILAQVTPGLAGRDLKDLSEQAERRWASKIIRSVVPKDQYEPPVDEYIAAAHQRVKEKQVKKRLPFQLL